MRNAAWAPATVLVLSFALGAKPHSTQFWWPLHLIGGAALAFFFFTALDLAADLVGRLRPSTQYVFAFALACTGGVAWEVTEFALDQLAGTTLQTGLRETMADLIFDTLGAAVCLILLALARRAKNERASRRSGAPR